MHDTHDAVGVKLQIRRPQAQINFGVARERRLGFYITSAEPEPLSQCKVSDLSLGGCYVEPESPFPRYTKIDLCLRAADLELHTNGIVRVMHPGHGMGVEFASRTSEQRSQVERFIEFLISQSDVTPQLCVAPKCIGFFPDDGHSSSNQDDVPDD